MIFQEGLIKGSLDFSFRKKTFKTIRSSFEN